jgi:hypothetical protein
LRICSEFRRSAARSCRVTFASSAPGGRVIHKAQSRSMVSFSLRASTTWCIGKFLRVVALSTQRRPEYRRPTARSPRGTRSDKAQAARINDRAIGRIVVHFRFPREASSTWGNEVSDYRPGWRTSFPSLLASSTVTKKTERCTMLALHQFDFYSTSTHCCR